MTGLIIGIIMFMVLVLVHELGHFITAKKSGIKVLEFGIGIPPKIGKIWTDKSGTEYTINLLPLGGFVRLKGEDPKDEQDFNAKDSFIKAKLGNKVIVLLAGVTANFLLAWILFTGVFAVGTRPISILPENAVQSGHASYLMPTKTFLHQQGYISDEVKNRIEHIPVTVDSTLPGYLAESIGLQTGDIITTINEKIVNARTIESAIRDIPGDNILIGIKRNNKGILLSGTCEDDPCVLGIVFAYTGFSKDELSGLDAHFIKFPLGQALVVGLQEIKAQTKLTFFALGNLGKNLISFNGGKIKHALNKLTGPVGAVKFGDTLLQAGGWTLFLGFAGIISLALALFNVLPIPALDGGRLLGVLIQGIGRLKAEKYFTIEGYLNLVFFVLLMGLGVYIIFKDLVRFWGVNIPFIGG